MLINYKELSQIWVQLAVHMLFCLTFNYKSIYIRLEQKEAANSYIWWAEFMLG